MEGTAGGGSPEERERRGIGGETMEGLGGGRHFGARKRGVTIPRAGMVWEAEIA